MRDTNLNEIKCFRCGLLYVHPERMQDYLIQRRADEYKHRLSR